MRPWGLCFAAVERKTYCFEIAFVVKTGRVGLMRILILHANEAFHETRRTSFNHAFALVKYAPQHQYTLQGVRQPVTERLRQSSFDVIVLDTTFLCWRWAKPRNLWLDRILDEYGFVGRSDAVKIALPQDEYDHSEYLDEWLSAWKVDLIYSVCFEHRDMFYQRALSSAEVVEGLTGFVDESDLELMSRYALPFEQRSVDVGYRARDLPAYFGRFGRMKAAIGDRFKERMSNSGLRLDISTQPEDTFAGDDWLKFLGRSRFTLGCESGSSLLDPRGAIRSCVDVHLQRNRDATFEDLERCCFPQQDMKRVYSAISPRLFEASIARSCQILVPGRYLGVLNADEHYIALSEDVSNADEILEKIADKKANLARIEACYQDLINNPRFRYSNFVKNLLQKIAEIGERKGLHKRLEDPDNAPPTNEAELRHIFARAIFSVHMDHLEDMKEINFVPDVRHQLAIKLRRILGYFFARFRNA